MDDLTSYRQRAAEQRGQLAAAGGRVLAVAAGRLRGARPRGGQEAARAAAGSRGARCGERELLQEELVQEDGGRGHGHAHEAGGGGHAQDQLRRGGTPCGLTHFGCR